MKKKLTCLLLSLMVAGSGIAGCGVQSEEAAQNPEPEAVQDEVGETASNVKEETASEEEETVTIEFAQWWEPELPEGAFRGLMDKFEEQNPGIKVELISGPYSSTQEQLVAGAAAGTMADVVGLDGPWISDFAKQGVIENLTELMENQGYDDSELAAQIQVDGATYMIPVANFLYPLFVNNTILEEAGIEKIPETRSEFVETAKAVTDAQQNIYGWVLPLNLESANGIQNDLMSWVWACDENMLTEDGQPDITGDGLRSVVEFVSELYDADAISPGAFAMQEQDKVEEFTNGRVAMMVSSLAHVTQIRENNPDLDFTIAPIPVADDFTGERGLHYAAWGLGVSSNSEHKEEAWKLIEFLMSEEINGELCTYANAFPGNKNAVPSFSDEMFDIALEMFQTGHLKNEFIGLPMAEDLMRAFDEQLQLMLEGDQDIDAMLANTQEAWSSALSE